jgi:hypothetical protein
VLAFSKSSNDHSLRSGVWFGWRPGEVRRDFSDDVGGKHDARSPSVGGGIADDNPAHSAAQSSVTYARHLPGGPKSECGAKPTGKVCVPMGGKSVAIAVFRPSLTAPMTDWIGSAGKFIREVDLGLGKVDNQAVVILCHWYRDPSPTAE